MSHPLTKVLLPKSPWLLCTWVQRENRFPGLSFDYGHLNIFVHTSKFRYYFECPFIVSCCVDIHPGHFYTYPYFPYNFTLTTSIHAYSWIINKLLTSLIFLFSEWSQNSMMCPSKGLSLWCGPEAHLGGKHSGGYSQRRGKDLAWRRLPQRSYTTGPSYKGASDGEGDQTSPKWGIDPPHGGNLYERNSFLCNYILFISHQPQNLSIVKLNTNSIIALIFYLPILTYYFILPNNFSSLYF